MEKTYRSQSNIFLEKKFNFLCCMQNIMQMCHIRRLLGVPKVVSLHVGEGRGLKRCMEYTFVKMAMFKERVCTFVKWWYLWKRSVHLWKWRYLWKRSVHLWKWRYLWITLSTILISTLQYLLLDCLILYFFYTWLYSILYTSTIARCIYFTC